MSTIAIKLGDTVTLYDRVTDSRTGVPLDLSAYNAISDVIHILFVNQNDSTLSVTKNAAPISPTGTAVFTNNSVTVTGTSTKFLNEVSPGDWITTTGSSTWYVVQSVESDVSLTLTTKYAGTTTSSVAYLNGGKIGCTLTVADFTFSSVATAGTYLCETLVNIGSVPHYGENNVLMIEPALSSYVAP